MQAKDIDVPEDMSIIDVVADKFLLEDGKEVADPVGNFSSKFTLKAQVILADKDYIRQISNIFRRVDLEVDGMVPVTLAERNLVLEPNELNDNVMILDIGAGNTDIGVFEGQNFIYTNTIPLGGDNITNDIAYVLNISLEEADKLKKQYGLAMKSYIDNDTEILLTSCKGTPTSRVIKSSELIEIIEARIEEIFTLINKDVSLQGVKSKINNVILTGQGVTNISKSDVVAKVALNIPVKMATGRALSTVRPGYRTVYSLIRYISTRQFAKNVSSNIDVQSGKDTIFKNILEKVKDFFYS
jgi:cell division protein FtsA